MSPGVIESCVSESMNYLDTRAKKGYTATYMVYNLCFYKNYFHVLSSGNNRAQALLK